jgi:predicted metal-dependent phosphoesterase TrpH
MDETSSAATGETTTSTNASEMMKIDLHCHTEASHDCTTPLQKIIDRCHMTNIQVQAITDHNQVWGALKLQEMTQGDSALTIIVGEEVSTREGEIIGLFLKERIQPGLSAEETVKRIKAQGGLVLIPHGFDPFKRHRLRPESLERIAKQVNIIEIFNAHVSQPSFNDAALLWASKHNKLKSAGTDAHTAAHVGSAWVETPRTEIHRPEDLLIALSMGKVSGRWRHPAATFVSRMKDLAQQTSRRIYPRRASKTLVNKIVEKI